MSTVSPSLLSICVSLAFLLSFVTISTQAFCVIGHAQSAAVEGTLLCEGKPMPDVEVKLYEKEVIKDTFMAKATTDARGHFLVKGSKCEISTIEPSLYIYHRCNNGGLRVCPRKFWIGVPKKYVTQSDDPKDVYDMGKHELSGRLSGESSGCIG